jgi:hypothetical protein
MFRSYIQYFCKIRLSQNHKNDKFLVRTFPLDFLHSTSLLPYCQI